MTAPNFNELLETKVDTVERPKPKPAGTWTGIVGSFKFDKSSQKQTPLVRYNLASVAPGADIDPQLLAQSGDLSKWKASYDFYLTEDALFMLREFLQSCGVPVEGRSFKETIPEAVGRPVVFATVAENRMNQQTGEEYVASKIVSIKGQ